MDSMYEAFFLRSATKDDYVGTWIEWCKVYWKCGVLGPFKNACNDDIWRQGQAAQVRDEEIYGSNGRVDWQEEFFYWFSNLPLPSKILLVRNMCSRHMPQSSFIWECSPRHFLLCLVIYHAIRPGVLNISVSSRQCLWLQATHRTGLV